MRLSFTKNKLPGFLLSLVIAHLLVTIGGGCAQIGAPTGGPKDTTAPVLIRAILENNSINFTGNKITLNFNEYIEVQDLQNNLFVSPLQKNNPVITSSLKTITIKFRDTLLPNTTYSINLGNAVKDVNEGNVYRNLTYTFSTGDHLDSLELSGNVLLAETGKVDSTLMVMLYRNASDSDVIKKKPDYVAKLNSEGAFLFKNLPADRFSVYALKDGDGSKTYNNPTELFAFHHSAMNTAENKSSVALLAYAEKKALPSTPASTQKNQKDKKLRYTTSLTEMKQDILQPLEITFSNAIKKFNASDILLTDTNYQPVKNAAISIDSLQEKVSINYKWKPGEKMRLIISKNAVEDNAGNMLAKSDSILFTCKSTEDYGTVVLRFKNFDVSKNPLIQFVEGDKIKFSTAVRSAEWSNKMFAPGEYELRILFDLNNNGRWDPGNYSQKTQPEKCYSFPQKITVKANWDNERDIELKQE